MLSKESTVRTHPAFTPGKTYQLFKRLVLSAQPHCLLHLFFLLLLNFFLRLGEPVLKLSRHPVLRWTNTTPLFLITSRNGASLRNERCTCTWYFGFFSSRWAGDLLNAVGRSNVLLLWKELGQWFLRGFWHNEVLRFCVELSFHRFLKNTFEQKNQITRSSKEHRDCVAVVSTYNRCLWVSL